MLVQPVLIFLINLHYKNLISQIQFMQTLCRRVAQARICTQRRQKMKFTKKKLKNSADQRQSKFLSNRHIDNFTFARLSLIFTFFINPSHLITRSSTLCIQIKFKFQFKIGLLFRIILNFLLINSSFDFYTLFAEAYTLLSFSITPQWYFKLICKYIFFASLNSLLLLHNDL